jgi:hypothetical protein
MKQRMTNILLGAILGAVLTQSLPGLAHTGGDAHLWRHIPS